MNIDQMYEIVEESSHEAAFNRGECEALYNLLREQQEHATWVEIGVQYGRSTTVFAEFAKEKNARFFAIDSWGEDVSSEAKRHVESQMQKHGWKFELLSMSSEQARSQWTGAGIHVLHIDGDHEYEAVKLDIQLWEPLVARGGYILFDDYGHDSLPGVYKAVQELLGEREDIAFIGRYGDKLGVFQKI
jgi:cephalosporin hydroxylase